jgi:hypothetical protein
MVSRVVEPVPLEPERPEAGSVSLTDRPAIPSAEHPLARQHRDEVRLDERPGPVGDAGEPVACPRLGSPRAHLAGPRIDVGINQAENGAHLEAPVECRNRHGPENPDARGLVPIRLALLDTNLLLLFVLGRIDTQQVGKAKRTEEFYPYGLLNKRGMQAVNFNHLLEVGPSSVDGDGWLSVGTWVTGHVLGWTPGSLVAFGDGLLKRAEEDSRVRAVVGGALLQMGLLCCGTAHPAGYR